MLKNLIITSLLLFGSVLGADYVYEADQDLFDLTNVSGTSNLNACDDCLSPEFYFGFDFEYYGNTFDFARISTNGCVGLGVSTNNSNYWCQDYTPDPLPQYPNTLFPFWTDLIRDSGSKMLAKNVADPNNSSQNIAVIGWYNMREYNRSGSDNTFEVWLYPNNTFEYRYGELDIIKHDVLIGEQGPTTSDIYTYLFFDECNTGTTNVSGTCVSYDWNSSSNSANTLLEDGGSLYGLGSGNALDCSNPLNNESCVGYAAAYLAQQCGLDSLYSTSCPLYWDAYDDLQCSLDPQYSPSCAGYTQEASVAYYNPDEYDYGYEDEYSEDNYGYEYEDEYVTDSCIDDPSYCYDDDPYNGMEFTDEEWYEIDLAEFGQEQVDEWYGTDVAFNEEGLIDWDTSPLETWEELDEHMDEYDEFIEDYEEDYYEEELYFEEEYFHPDEIYEEDLYFVDSYEEDPTLLTIYEEDILDVYEEHYDTDYDLVYNVVGEEEEFIELFEFNTIITEDIEYEEEDNYLVFENEEELDEWFEEEMEESQETIEEQFVEAEEESFEEEAIEEIYEDLEEEWIAEAEDEEVVLEDLEEVELVGTTEREESSSMDMETALNVVANTVQSATESVSGTTAGTSVHATGNTVASGGSLSVGTTAITTVASSVSSGGISTSNSPSISAQVASSAMQTQQVLSSFNADSSVATMETSVMEPTTTVETLSVEIASTEEVATQTLEPTTDTTATTSIDTSSSVASSTTETSTASSTTSTATSTTMTETAQVVSQVTTVEVQVQDMQGQIDNAVVDAGTASEADQIADQIIAQNIQSQQQEAETYQQETGQYGDQSTLVAYLGYNAGFTDYYGRSIPRKDDWYEPRVIYADAYIGDNINAFYQLAGDSLNTLQKLKDLQPTL